MSYEHTITTTIDAPAGFVRAFLLDVENWPRLKQLPAGASLRLQWEGPAWEQGSTLIMTSIYNKRATSIRALVCPREPGELYRTTWRMAGSRVSTVCRVDEMDPQTAVVSYAERMDGWVSLVGKMSSALGGAQFHERQLKSEVALAWHRSVRAAAASPGQQAVASPPSQMAP